MTKKSYEDVPLRVAKSPQEANELALKAMAAALEAVPGGGPALVAMPFMTPEGPVMAVRTITGAGIGEQWLLNEVMQGLARMSLTNFPPMDGTVPPAQLVASMLSLKAMPEARGMLVIVHWRDKDAEGKDRGSVLVATQPGDVDSMESFAALAEHGPEWAEEWAQSFRQQTANMGKPKAQA